MKGFSIAQPSHYWRISKKSLKKAAGGLIRGEVWKKTLPENF